jgi:hypothetical protein
MMGWYEESEDDGVEGGEEHDRDAHGRVMRDEKD